MKAIRLKRPRNPTQKSRTYRSLEKALCKSFYSQFLKLQALNQISKETLLIHLPNERKSSTYSIKKDEHGNKIGFDPFKDDNHCAFYNKMKRTRDIIYIIELKRMGILKGLPDYLLLPRLGFIEAKVIGQELEPDQIKFRNYCHKHNIPWHLLEDYAGIESAFEFIKGI